MNRLHAAAHRYAEQGWAVFPLTVRDKLPLLGKCPDADGLRGPDLATHAAECPSDGHGFHDATTNTTVIDRWWTATPEANIGIATGTPSGFWVLDEDQPDAIAALCDKVRTDQPDNPGAGRLPITLSQTTGSGGRHLLWALPDGDMTVTNRAHMNGHAVDVRGTGGYIVAPPSIHPSGGEYRWDGRHGLAHAPQWLLDQVLRTPMPDRTGEQRDHAQYIGVGSRWGLSTLEGCCNRLAQTTHGRNDALFREAVYAYGAVKSGHLDQTAADSALTRHAEQMKVYDTPSNPFTTAEITTTLRSAWHAANPVDPPAVDKHGRPYGERRITPTADVPHPASPPPPPPADDDNPFTGPLDVPEPEPPARRWPIYTTAQLAQIRPPDWIIDGHVPDGFVVMYGASGSFKSFLALDWALSCATGHAWLGTNVRSSPVVYVAAEGASGTHQRVNAWKTDRTRKADALHTIPAAPNLLSPADADALADDVISHGAGLLVIDTMARCMVGGDENSAQDVGRFIAALDGIRRQSNCGVLVVHHSGHEATRPRGSTALFAAADAVIRVAQDDTTGDIDVRCDKQKDAAPFRRWTLTHRPVGESVVLASSGYTERTVEDPQAAVRILLAMAVDPTSTALHNAGLTDSQIDQLVNDCVIEKKPGHAHTYQSYRGAM